MELTNKQTIGLDLAIRRWKDGEKYTVIAGYAGTGKSTLVKFIISALSDYGIKPERDVAYATFTGKAAEVLRKKGNPNAITLHKLLYDHIPKANGGFLRKEKRNLEYKVVVVDEVSMVPKSMLDILLKHKIYVLFLGDPFQLPMIDKKESHNLLDHPHIFLDEIMRQEAESEIIQLTMKIRNGEKIDFSNGKEVMVIPKKELVTGHLLWADQIICATNNTRISINNQVRQLLGYEGLPKDGEKLICLRNYWDDISTNGNAALVNGTTGIIKNAFENFRLVPMYIKIENHKVNFIQCDFIADGGDEFTQVNMDKNMILTGEPCMTWKEAYNLNKYKKQLGEIVPKEFAFGYAITCHKAQGSEYDNVLVIEESFPFDKEEHARWLYTACTRAANKLVLVR